MILFPSLIKNWKFSCAKENLERFAWLEYLWNPLANFGPNVQKDRCHDARHHHASFQGILHWNKICKPEVGTQVTYTQNGENGIHHSQGRIQASQYETLKRSVCLRSYLSSGLRHINEVEVHSSKLVHCVLPWGTEGWLSYFKNADREGPALGSIFVFCINISLAKM